MKMNEKQKAAQEYLRAADFHWWGRNPGSLTFEWQDPSPLLCELFGDCENLAVKPEAYLQWESHDRGKTICFRQELINFLHTFQGHDLPRFDTLLVLLSSLKESWLSSKPRSILSFIGHRKTDQIILDYLDIQNHTLKALQFLDLVNSLKETLKSGPQKFHTLFMLASLMPKTNQPVPVDEVIHFLNHGTYHQTGRQHHSRRYTGKAFQYMVADLTSALEKIDQKDDLAHFIESGLKHTPKPPEFVLPEPDLLSGLALNTKTAGLARLARLLKGSLHVPMHTVDHIDLPTGGVADISNKGNFDKLLISEWAYDHDTLLSRLVNHEALYLKRASPPAPHAEHRHILVDTTLRMWGLPRIYAIASALAISTNEAEKTTIDVFQLGKDTFAPVALNTPEGVLHFLKLLNPGIHAIDSLQAFLTSRAELETVENIFITSMDNLQQMKIHPAWGSIKNHLHFVIAVARNGGLVMKSLRNGDQSNILQLHIDLQEVLIKDDQPTQTIRSTSFHGFPEIYRRVHFPLNIPMGSFTPDSSHSYGNRSIGLMAVDRHMRVVYWTKNGDVVRELMPKIESGQYYMAKHQEGIFGILVYQPVHKKVFYYVLSVEEETVNKYLLPDHDGTTFNAMGTDKGWHIYDGKQAYFIKLRTTESTGQCNKKQTESVRKHNPLHDFDFQWANKLVKTNYNLLLNIHKVWINKENQLLINDWALTVNQYFRWSKSKALKPKVEATYVESYPFPENDRLTLKKFSFPNGNLVLVDNRGFLHLIYGEDHHTQITITLILNKTLTLYTNDCSYTGNRRFISHQSTNLYLDEMLFYRKFIAPFIEETTAK